MIAGVGTSESVMHCFLRIAVTDCLLLRADREHHQPGTGEAVRFIRLWTGLVLLDVGSRTLECWRSSCEDSRRRSDTPLLNAQQRPNSLVSALSSLDDL